MPAKKHVIDLEPVGRRVEVEDGETLLEAAQSAGIELVSLCGGIGSCDSCRVRLVQGRLSPPTIAEQAEFRREQLAAGWRLACQAQPLDDAKIDIPPESLTTPQRLQVEGISETITLDPVVTPLDLRLDAPSMDDLRADVTRLNAAVPHPLTIPLPVMQQLPHRLRDQDWQARLAVRHDRTLTAVLHPTDGLFGLAVDIGTTALAAYLVDLESGGVAAKTGAMNPQIAYGEDVISRINYLNKHPSRGHILQQHLVETLNAMLDALCRQASISKEQVVEVVVVGNTAMHHIFAGLPVKQLGEAPYVSATSDPLEFPAGAVGLRTSPGALVYSPPSIAGYVGADHVAMLLATGTWGTRHTVIAIDIGTNTEVTLAHAGGYWSCSCASGPAFEGAHIHDGMRAAPGAIERVQLFDDGIRFQTIGGQPPVGICGSGILDAVAVMAGHGVVDHRGAFQKDHPLVSTDDDGQPILTLASAASAGHGRSVRINRRDIAEIQLAKSAIRAGIEILLKEAGIRIRDVDEFIIAGAFGTYINIASAQRIGMFPALPLSRFQQVGNAAGMGARHLLVTRTLRQQAVELARHIQYIELTTYAGFQDEFILRMSL